MDETTRAIGRLEGKFDGIESALQRIETVVNANAHIAADVGKRVATLEGEHAKAKGIMLGVSAVAGAAGAVFTWAVKKTTGLI